MFFIRFHVDTKVDEEVVREVVIGGEGTDTTFFAEGKGEEKLGHARKRIFSNVTER